MSKRFIDTELFEDPWFMDLSISAKVLWMYCITKCDHAGILKWNERLIQFQTGVKNMDTVKQELGNRLYTVNKEYVFIPKFFDFQYPNYPDKKFKAAESAIEILKKFNLIDNTTLTLKQELTNSYSNCNSNSIGKGKKGVEGEKKGKCLMKTSGVTLKIIEDSFMKSDDLKMADPKYYFNSALAWSDSKGEMRVDWVATVSNFARRDIRDGKMKIRPKARFDIVKPKNDDYGKPSPTSTTMPEGMKKRLLNIGKENP